MKTMRRINRYYAGISKPVYYSYYYGVLKLLFS